MIILKIPQKHYYLNKKRRKKAPFIRKLDVFAVLMRKKLIERPDKYRLLKENVEILRKEVLKRRKIKDETIVEMMRMIRMYSVA